MPLVLISVVAGTGAGAGAGPGADRSLMDEDKEAFATQKPCLENHLRPSASALLDRTLAESSKRSQAAASMAAALRIHSLQTLTVPSDGRHGYLGLVG
ncbi:hypothetical protein CTA1_6262 [Colletotrichum tanaceti]|uniref:Uncharacterized protein n=1 Tax=Colletotrichum tanaceti TaxID=1306861 RepID=A0A4U6X333_9PEZI|nr:hypothetical protein CTA1_6262 [Colletotrichum tanaceti]